MPQAPNKTIKAIDADRVIDGVSPRPLEGRRLVTEGSHIKGIYPQGQTPETDGRPTAVHRFEGCTLLPGLIDCHTHTNMPGNGRKGEEVDADDDETRLARSLQNVRAALETGVTTLCDNGAWNSLGFTLKRELGQGGGKGPRVLVCGNPITIRRGHCWFMGSEVEGVDGARTGADRLLDAGADFLKVMTTGGSTLGTNPYAPAFSPEELKAIIDAAKDRGVFTVAHARCTAGISMAVEAGFDIIAHCVFAAPDQSYKFDPWVAGRLIERGVWSNPTLALWESRLRLLKERAQKQPLTQEEKQELATGEQKVWERKDESRRLKEMGAGFVAGSDCGWGVYPFGYFVREMEAFVEAGLSPMESIMAGTSSGARALRVFDKVGSLEPGKEADLLLVKGDPTRDISSLGRVVAVFKAGELVKPSLVPAGGG